MLNRALSWAITSSGNKFFLKKRSRLIKASDNRFYVKFMQLEIGLLQLKKAGNIHHNQKERLKVLLDVPKRLPSYELDVDIVKYIPVQARLSLPFKGPGDLQRPPYDLSNHSS